MRHDLADVPHEAPKEQVHLSDPLTQSVPWASGVLVGGVESLVFVIAGSIMLVGEMLSSRAVIKPGARG